VGFDVGQKYKMTIREKTIELIVTAATIVVLSIIVFFASAYGARGLSEMYGDTHQFRIESQLAITAYRWSPFLFATILLGYFWLRLRRVERRWAR